MGPAPVGNPAWFDRIRITIQRYGMLARGDRAGVAVSGGADSVALLHVLQSLRSELGIELEVLHLDHGLRGADSDADASFVAQLAGGLGLPFHSRRASLHAAPGNLEQEARRARLAFFADMRAERQLDRVATGHTRSDQAETVLFRLLRGAGPPGLAGILPVTREGLIRPLLEVTRQQARDWLRERALPWREDASNLDRALARNRIRLDLLPALARDWNPQLETVLAHTAVLAAEDEAAWAALVEWNLLALAHVRPPALLFEVARLRALPPALARRVLRAAAVRASGAAAGAGFPHVEALLDLVLRPEGDGRASLPGLDAWRSFDWLRLAPPASSAGRNWEMPISLPADLRLPDGSRLVVQVLIRPALDGSAVVPGESLYNEGSSALDFNRLGKPLVVRAWRPGDVYQPEGLAAAEKLKTMFQRTRIPLWDRRDWPIITAGDEIVWARRFGAAARFRAREAAREWLRIEDRPDSAGVGESNSP